MLRRASHERDIRAPWGSDTFDVFAYDLCTWDESQRQRASMLHLHSGRPFSMEHVMGRNARVCYALHSMPPFRQERDDIAVGAIVLAVRAELAGSHAGHVRAEKVRPHRSLAGKSSHIPKRRASSSNS